MVTPGSDQNNSTENTPSSELTGTAVNKLPDNMTEEDVEREVVMLLGEVSTAEELQELCAGITLDVPTTEIAGKTRLLYKHLLCHLNSKELVQMNDQGLSVFLTLYGLMTEPDKKFMPKLEEKPLSLGDVNQVKVDATSTSTKQNGGESSSASYRGDIRRKPLFDMQKLKDFKIDGKIGGAASKPDTILRFSSLKHQVENGLRQGHTEDVVIEAVLRAISPSNELRPFLENKTGLTVESLLKSLRGQFQEKESSAAFSDLTKAFQTDDQTAYGFCVHAFVLRDNVETLWKKERVPYDPNFLSKTVLDAIDTGLKNQNIRHEIKHLTTFDAKHMIVDDDLLEAVSRAEANEAERLGKMAEKKNRSVEVNSLQKKDKTEKAEANKKNDLQARLVKQENDIAVLTANVCELSSAVKNLVTAGQNPLGQQGDGAPGNQGGPQGPQGPQGPPPGQQGGGGGNRNRRNDGNQYQSGFRRRGSPQCHNCVISRNPGRCNHCYRCSSDQHKMGDCPLNG